MKIRGSYTNAWYYEEKYFYEPVKVVIIKFKSSESKYLVSYQDIQYLVFPGDLQNTKEDCVGAAILKSQRDVLSLSIKIDKMKQEYGKLTNKGGVRVNLALRELRAKLFPESEKIRKII